jgi:hypothetical protein
MRRDLPLSRRRPPTYLGIGLVMIGLLDVVLVIKAAVD